MTSLLAATELPPVGHPMRAYAEQMTGDMQRLSSDVTALYHLGAVVLVALLIGIAVFAVFAYQKYQERQEMRKHRTEVVELTTACGAILASVKSRGIILERAEEKKAETLTQVTAEMKATLAEMPPKTAELTKEAVMEALDKKGDSGTKLPQVRPDPLAGLGGTT